jgi:hypothetical protein
VEGVHLPRVLAASLVQYYNMRKRAETVLKSFHYKSSDISAVSMLRESIQHRAEYAIHY